MNDNNFRDIIGARLEEIHMAETMPENMPSEEDILRWETLAKARTADRKRKMRRFISIAAVFLLAVVIGVAVIVGPPDAEAGGEGNAVIVENGDGMVVAEYESINSLPEKILRKFILIDNKKYQLEVAHILYTSTKNTEQLEIMYKDKDANEIIITEIINHTKKSLESESNYLAKKEKIGRFDVHIVDDPKIRDKRVYIFSSNDVFINIYTNNHDEGMLRTMIKEAF